MTSLMTPMSNTSWSSKPCNTCTHTPLHFSANPATPATSLSVRPAAAEAAMESCLLQGSPPDPDFAKSRQFYNPFIGCRGQAEQLSAPTVASAGLGAMWPVSARPAWHAAGLAQPGMPMLAHPVGPAATWPAATWSAPVWPAWPAAGLVQPTMPLLANPAGPATAPALVWPGWLAAGLAQPLLPSPVHTAVPATAWHTSPGWPAWPAAGPAQR